MTPAEFSLTQDMIGDDWEYLGIDDAGRMMFSRMVDDVIFTALVSEDR